MNTHTTATKGDWATQDTTALPATDELGDFVSAFAEARPGLLKIANRILGDANEAEDIIQETWVRWQGTDRTVVVNPTALLRTTTIRLAINVVQSARRRRESPAGPWLPEPTGAQETPENAAERQDAVERAILLLMQTLTPNQRTAYVLREGFGYPHVRIAELLHLNVANARQQITRAQARLAAHRSPQPVDSVAHRRLVQAFLGAAQSGDLTHLEEVLCADSTPRADREPARPVASR
ncbi:sigma-70 family RNA polymerase sigma factor [Streptomyces sp. ADI93-02]|uniref:sigma-70 family RNA polymerase sigma factor n=1 Tax=Streptomyces sp. ADI93-02 TaxID=1522757 RepID=UPI000F5560E8|nr:sigma-70 family RNA polymerase sigma factor [Streptomyces sp. ADI93-02]RPK32213.1 ECF RNA polymerase sigma factor SigJ [Streptomyces sp. ADI93-02]